MVPSAITTDRRSREGGPAFQGRVNDQRTGARPVASVEDIGVSRLADLDRFDRPFDVVGRFHKVQANEQDADGLAGGVVEGLVMRHLLAAEQPVNSWPSRIGM